MGRYPVIWEYSIWGVWKKIILKYNHMNSNPSKGLYKGIKFFLGLFCYGILSHFKVFLKKIIDNSLLIHSKLSRSYHKNRRSEERRAGKERPSRGVQGHE